jgi:hypothetical protein
MVSLLHGKRESSEKVQFFIITAYHLHAQHAISVSEDQGGFLQLQTQALQKNWRFRLIAIKSSAEGKPSEFI